MVKGIDGQTPDGVYVVGTLAGHKVGGPGTLRDGTAFVERAKVGVAIDGGAPLPIIVGGAENIGAATGGAAKGDLVVIPVRVVNGFNGKPPRFFWTGTDDSRDGGSWD